MTSCGLDGEIVHIDKALALKGSGAKPNFRCLECAQPVRAHRAGGLVQAHFEHADQNPLCALGWTGPSMALSSSADPPADGSEGWTDEQLRASVAAYLGMLARFRAGLPIIKKDVYSSLANQFVGRTAKAFEYRMQNISYVLSLLGRQWLPGLRPAKNVGARVAAKIELFIAEQEGRPVLPVAAFEIEVGEARKRLGSVPPAGTTKPSTRESIVVQYDRDPAVKAWVLMRANGICECCDEPAPFHSLSGPFLEVHHVFRLADGGSDTTSNAIAICPNCHRRLHYAIDAADLIESLYKKSKRLIREIVSAEDTVQVEHH